MRSGPTAQHATRHNGSVRPQRDGNQSARCTPVEAPLETGADRDRAGPFAGHVDFGGMRFPIIAGTAEILAEFGKLGAVPDIDSDSARHRSPADGVVAGPQLTVTASDNGFITRVDDSWATPTLASPLGSDQNRRFGAPVPVGGGYQTVSAAVHGALAVMTERVVRLEPGWLHLHAGAVVVGGIGIVIPAGSGVGKTTLVSELAPLGGVITDELVAVDRPGEVLRAPRRPLSVKSSGFARIAARHEALVPPDPDEFVWHLDLAAIGVGHVTAAPPGAIALPRRRPGAVQIEAIPAGEALLALVANSFDLDVDPSRAFDDLIWLVSTCHCVRVDYGEAADVGDPLAVWLDTHREPPSVAAMRFVGDDDTVLAVRLDDSEVLWDTTSRDVIWRQATS